jgi:hypothetical protein
MTPQLRIRSLVIGLGATLAVAASLAAATWPSSSRGDTADAAVPVLPDWFLPIWDYYDRNPAVTPQFDFARLYSGEPSELARGRRG